MLDAGIARAPSARALHALRAPQRAHLIPQADGSTGLRCRSAIQSTYAAGQDFGRNRILTEVTLTAALQRETTRDCFRIQCGMSHARYL